LVSHIAAAETREDNEDDTVLLTNNPPLSVLKEGIRARIGGFVMFAVGAIACVISIAIRPGYLAHNPPDKPPLYLAVGTALILTFGGLYRLQDEKFKAKWPTNYRPLLFEPILKSGNAIVVEIQIEIPKTQDTPETLFQLVSATRAPLFNLFADADTPPSRQDICECVSKAMAKKQREIGLAICRMEVVTITERKPPTPPLPSTRPPEPQQPYRRTGFLGSN
jgi:hypothetical protein